MSSFYIIRDPRWPDLTNWERVEKYSWAECDTIDYFSDWGRRWGDEVTQSNALYRGAPMSLEGIGLVRFAYIAIVTLSTDAPDIKATNEYIKHQENLCYPIPTGGISGRARFIGAKIENGQTQLYFIISDPQLDRAIFAQEASVASRLLN